MKILVVGGGGREHAIVAALARDPDVAAVHCAPGNPGTAEIADNHVLDPLDPKAVVELAHRIRAQLVVIGPEAPLVAEVSDALRADGMVCFGPDAAAARIESSKAFAKEIMAAAGVRTATARVCDSDDDARDALETFGPPYVVKDDGPAAGKGVLVTEDGDAALAHAQRCDRVVIEEYLDGPEVSLFGLCDGTTVVPLLPARDFKRAGDGDTGPNTGGMGAYTPVPRLPPEFAEEMTARVLRPVVDELRDRGTPYVGLLYAGLALCPDGVAVVEFNARFGDPETQVILDRLATPIGSLLQATAIGALGEHERPAWKPGAAVTVVIAAENYPGEPVTGDLITGVDDVAAVPGAYVLHAGTRLDSRSGALYSAGGRVLDVVGTGQTLTEARETAYTAVGGVRMRGMHYRRDIAGTAPVP